MELNMSAPSVSSEKPVFYVQERHRADTEEDDKMLHRRTFASATFALANLIGLLWLFFSVKLG